MYVIDDKLLRGLHNLMREKGVNKVNVSMFSPEQQKMIYEGYGEQFLIYNGMWFMINAVVSYSLANNIEMVNKKLKAELDYAFKAHDYDYAMLCARLLQDNEMTEFLKNYTTIDKHAKVYIEMINFIQNAKK